MRPFIKNLTRSALLLLVLLSAIGIKKVNATHFAGADMYLDMISTDSTILKYRVFLIVYKACEPNSSDLYPTETIQWVSNHAGVTGSRTIPASPFDTVDQLCPNFSATNSCRQVGSTYPGFVRAYYIDTVTLPSRQTDWVFSWSDGSRNGGINNLGPTPGSSSNYNIYIEAGINNTGTHWNNSTPRYMVDPFPYLCVNQQNSFLNGAVDPDLDSLVTVTQWPQSGPGANIPFRPVPAPGYSLAAPFGVGNPYTVNPNTGTAYFVPPNTGKYVIAFRTNAFDRYPNAFNKYDSLGYIRRDVQVSVLPCNAPPPALDTVITPSSGAQISNGVISVCPNTPADFTITANSQSGANTLVLSSPDHATGAPGSTFTTAYGTNGSATGTFRWTPTTADIGTHTITIKAVDTTCTPSQPILLSRSFIITIRVLPGLDAGPDRKICPLGDNPVVLRVSGPQTNIYNWRRLGGPASSAQFISCLTCPVVTVTPPYDYTYVVTTNDPLFACKNKDTVNVLIDTANSIIATQDPLVVCRPGYVTFTSQPVGAAPVSNLPCGTTNTVNCPTPELITLGNLGNTSSDPKNTPFYTSYKYHKYQFIVTKQELFSSGMYSGTIRSISFKSNNPVILGPNPPTNVRISLKCTRNSRYPNTISNADFETGTTLVATVPSLPITANGWNTITLDQPYNWDTSQNLLVDICMGDAGFTPNPNGTDPVDMAPGQAIQRVSNTVDVCGATAPGPKLYLQRPVVRFGYCLAPDLPFQFQWAPGTYLSDSNLQNPVAYVPRSGNYKVFTRGKNGCKVYDSLRVIVPIHTLNISPADTALCVGQNGRLVASGASAGYIWYENGFNTPTTLSCDNCPDPVVIPQQAGTYVYTVVFLDTAGCFDTLTATVHAYPLPGVTIVNNDTTIKFGQHVPLMVYGANQYSWTPAGSLSDPNSPNPIATPTQSTQYIVYGLTEHQCRNSDTVQVNVDFRDNLLVPSGFTPNGDGKNDVFKIVNVTFQKLMEFRVFNRWGQEVFSTNDPMKGWDGKWKGVDQDLGNYTYIIRVAYPDGFVETYKGDVSLIR